MEIKRFSQLTSRLFLKEIGKYASTSGVNKFYSLLGAIDIGINHLHWDEIIKYIESDLDKLKKFEQTTQNKTIYSKVKDWNQLYNQLEIIRPKLTKIQMRYDEIYKKKMDDVKEFDKINSYRIEAQKISPYAPELYYLLNAILEMTDMQNMTIPNEYLKSAELSEYQKNSFFKEPSKKEESHTTTEESSK